MCKLWSIFEKIKHFSYLSTNLDLTALKMGEITSHLSEDSTDTFQVFEIFSKLAELFDKFENILISCTSYGVSF